MKISYIPLRKLLIDRKLTMNQLAKMTSLSSATMAKLNKGDNLNTNVLVRICEALNCNLTDIMELEK